MSELPIGKLIDDTAGRDAIHIAIAPVTAGEDLAPGAHIGFMDDKKELVCGWKSLIGIVDPFLKDGVKRGERFWMFLYPNTITSLRHEWTHPAFEDPKAASEKWLRIFAEQVGLSYAMVLSAAIDFARYGDYHTFGYDTPSFIYKERPLFWKHIEIVTGETFNNATKESMPFTCSC